MADTMTRKDFLKKLGLGALGLAVVGSQLKNPITAQAAVADNVSSGGGVCVQVDKPANTQMLWIDKATGIPYYCDPDTKNWQSIRSVWGNITR